MNPLTNTRNICQLNENELKAGIFDHKISWHADYSHSAYIFVGGLPFELTEGDIICVFSQYGEIVNIHLVRDQKTGKSKGFCFVAYEDQRSTILAVDNLNSIKLGGRTIRVDHVSDFKPPKSGEKDKFGNRLLLTPQNCSQGAPTNSNTNANNDIKPKHSDRSRDRKYERRRRSRSRSSDRYKRSPTRRHSRDYKDSKDSRSKRHDRRRSRDRY